MEKGWKKATITADHVGRVLKKGKIGQWIASTRGMALDRSDEGIQSFGKKKKERRGGYQSVTNWGRAQEMATGTEKRLQDYKRDLR